MHLSLLFSGYAFAISRMGAVFVLRLLADPLTVGTLNTIQSIVNITTPLSLGSTYFAARTIPTLNEQEKALRTTSSLLAVLIEGVFVAVATLGILIVMTNHTNSLRVTTLFFILLFTIVYRLQTYFESALQALRHFKQVSLMRLVRTLEPFAAIAGLYWWGIDGYLCFSFAFISYIIFRNWQKLGNAFHISTAALQQAMKSLKKPNSYGMWVAAERSVMGISSIADALLVTLTLGPVALSGYYLGVNVRGLLQQVASTFIFHRWAHAVNTYENDKKDIFSNNEFLTKYLLLSSTLLGGTFLALYGAFEWVLPSYKQHFLECIWGAAVAIPYSFTGFLRVSQLLAMRGKQLLLLSLGRLGSLALAYALLKLNHIPVTALTVGKLAYATAAIEFSINYFIVTSCSLRGGFVWLNVCVSPIALITLFGFAV